MSLNDRANGSQYRPTQRALKKSVKPRVQPPVPVDPWDFAFLTLGDFNDAIVTVDGVQLPTFGVGGFVDGIVDEMFKRGIGVYTTYDSYGCFTLYRFQNLTNKRVNISMDNAVWIDSQFGVSVLPDDPLYADVINPTIELIKPDEIYEGGSNLSFSLAPNVTPILVGVHPYQVVYREGITAFAMYLKNENNDLFSYQFRVNDVLFKDPDGNSHFTFTNQSELNDFWNIFKDTGVSLDSYVVGAFARLDMGFSTVGTGDLKAYKIEVIQTGNLTPSSDNFIAIEEETSYSTDQFKVERGANFVSYTAYLYDPLDVDAR